MNSQRRTALAAVAVCVLVSVASAAAQTVASAAAPMLGTSAPVSRAADQLVASAAGWIDVRDGVRRLGARSDGVVARVLVKEGDVVEAGALLVQFEDSPAVVEHSLAALEVQRLHEQRRMLSVRRMRAREEVMRLKALAAQGAEAVDVLRQAQRVAVEVDSDAVLIALAEREATLKLELTREHIARLRVRAPRRGQVLHVGVHVGDSVAAGSSLLSFAPDGPLIVRAELDERLFGRVLPGMAARVTPEYDETHFIPARVLRVARSVGPVQDLPQIKPVAKDDRVVECTLEIATTHLLIGQRVVVQFWRRP